MLRADLFKLVAVEINADKIIRKFGLEDGGRVQQYIDSECLRLCAPKVPKDNNLLIRSGNANTKIGSGEVIYDTPYARRWYYMPANFQDGSGSGMGAVGRGNYWFERMKQEHREDILKGAQKRANEGGNGN